jgi:hypothetical protein
MGRAATANRPRGRKANGGIENDWRAGLPLAIFRFLPSKN